MNEALFKEIQNEDPRSGDVDASCDAGWPVPGIHGVLVVTCLITGLATLSFNRIAG